MEQRVLEGSVAVLGSMVAFGCAIFLLRQRAANQAHQRLANVLAFEGILNGFLGAFMLLEYPVWGWCEWNVHQNLSFVQIGFGTTAAIVPWYYALFLGTLGTRLVAPFAGRYARRIVSGGVAATTLLFVATLAWYPPCPFTGNLPNLGAISWMLLASGSIYGLVASISVQRNSPEGTHSRAKQNAFLVAFGARDALYLVVILVNVILVDLIGVYTFDPLILPAFVVFAYVPLVVRGIRKVDMLRSGAAFGENAD